MNEKYSIRFIRYLVTECELSMEEINSMSRNEIFDTVLNYEGYMGHHGNLKRIIKDVYGIDLNKVED